MCDLCYPKHTRREFVSTGIGATAVMLGLRPPAGDTRPNLNANGESERPHLETAINAAHWIEASRIETAHGITWPADPADPESVGATLYSHSPGVVLFLLELYYTTGDSKHLERACSGADHLEALQGLEQEAGAGLYTGTSGILFCLAETFRASGRSKYREAAIRVLETIHQSAQSVGSGLTWSPVTDIISGTAGTGLTLLYADSALTGTDSTAIAAGAGRSLLDLARPESGGLKWPMADEYPRLMPNFSHGTAGVSYFLASLYEATGDREFLDAAIAGAMYLRAVARTEADTFSVFHNEPDGLDLYYLGWCHGPPGTARLFYKLAKLTGDADWMTVVHQAANTILQSGIPEQETHGFWNNVSQCCGHVGVGDFFLSLHRASGNASYLEFAERVTSDLLRRASRGADGVCWVQAEHRTRPELLAAQTGYMQGAAGIGTYFLHLDALERDVEPAITLPDTPF